MDPLTIALIGGGLGLGKGLMDKDAEDRQRKVAAITARWSPWTGMSPQMPRDANVLGSTLEGALAGAMLGKQFGGGGAADKPLEVPQLTESDYMGSTGQDIGYLGYDPFQRRVNV